MRAPRARSLFDLFCRDMDASLREMGVGDLAVPRKMRGIGEAFYGRQAAYRAALGGARGRGACRRRWRAMYSRRRAPPARAGWPPMSRAAVRELAAQDGAAFSRGELRFPDPREVTVAAVAAGAKGA